MLARSTLTQEGPDKHPQRWTKLQEHLRLPTCKQGGATCQLGWGKATQRGGSVYCMGTRRQPGDWLTNVLIMWEASVVSVVGWKWAPISYAEFKLSFRHNRQLSKPLWSSQALGSEPDWNFATGFHIRPWKTAVKFLEDKLHKGIELFWSNFERPWIL